MINIDFLTLRAFLSENIDFLIGSRLQKVRQPTRRDFIFSLRNNGESRKLYININPQYYHIAFMSSENERKRGIIIPQKPPMFCMLLRKYLEGARICDAVVVENERIFELHFEVYDELSQQRSLCLVTELMGKHSNVILYDRGDNTIIGCAHNIGAEKSRYRELQGGLKYIYPPKTKFSLSNELKNQFMGLSESKVNEYLNSIRYAPAIKDDRYTLFSELIEGSVPQESVNDMLDNYYSEIQSGVNLKNVKSKLTEIAQAKLKKINNSISKMTILLNKRNNTEKYKLYGDLLTANLHNLSDYAKTAEVFDYVNNVNVTIELDETKTLNQNAQRYYKLYSKSKMTKAKTEEMLENLNIEREYYENVLYGIEKSENTEALDDIKQELGVESEAKPDKKLLKPVLEKRLINGFDVYVGKNNKQNDYIVSKLAKDNDYWFHTRMCAGSHVLLKVKETEPDEKVIFECCKLAREFSSASQPSKVGVIYTRGKYLRKPPAAPLGYVTYKNEKEVLI